MQDLHRRAVRQSVDIVAAVRDEQWDAATPCAQWTLRQLLEHMVAQHNGFAAAAGGETKDDSVWKVRPLDGDPRVAHAESAERVIAAFAQPGVLERDLWLPEIRRTGGIPGRLAISFHFVDYVVHGWDVGAAIGVPPDFDDDIVEAALEVTRRFVPADGPSREGPSAAFGPALPVPADVSGRDQLLLMLGRSPAWPD